MFNWNYLSTSISAFHLEKIEDGKFPVSFPLKKLYLNKGKNNHIFIGKTFTIL